MLRSTERFRLLSIGLIALFVVAACAGPSGNRGPGGPKRGGPPGGGGPGFAAGGPIQQGPDRFYSQALALKRDGNCAEAVPLFKRVAEIGRGYEIAQYHLGDCLLQTAVEKGTGAQAEMDNALAMHWLLKAAHSNNADAQGKLAAIYLNSDVVAQDRVAAAKWYLLYMRNPIQVKVGATALAPGVERYLLDELRPQEWAAATAAADSWQVVQQDINRPAQDPRGPGGRDGERERPRRLTENISMPG